MVGLEPIVPSPEDFMHLSSKRRIQALAAVLIIAVCAYASVTGPLAGYTDAPGDFGNCSVCHDQYAANFGTGSVRINDVPAVYTANQQYTITVITQQNGQSRFGFQLTVLNSSNAGAGTLTPLDGTTQLNATTGPGNRQYIQHTEVGTFPTISGGRGWQFRWTAPSSDVGTVRFYAAGNAANNSGEPEGDYIYTTSAVSDSPSSGVTVAFVNDPGGKTLSPGSQTLIEWTLT